MYVKSAACLLLCVSNQRSKKSQLELVCVFAGAGHTRSIKIDVEGVETSSEREANAYIVITCDGTVSCWAVISNLLPFALSISSYYPVHV